MNFEVDKFKIVEENSNSQFATIEVDLCRSGNNSHNLIISKDAIKFSANSIKEKPILAKYNRYRDDFEGHAEDEIPVGFFGNEDPLIHEKDGELWVTAKGKIWKKYFDNVMGVFKKKDGKTQVSMEIEMLEGEDSDFGEDGKIDLFCFTGLTLLGVKPAIAEAEARVLTFSELKNTYYEEDSVNSLKQFAEERRKKFLEEKEKYVSHPVNTSKEAMYDGEWDGNKAKQDLVKEKNYLTLAPKVCLRLEDGWRGREVTKIGYPIMGLHNGEWVYFRKGLSAALSYAKGENDDEIVRTVEALYKKFKLEEGEDKKMEKKEFSELEGRPVWAEVIKRVHEKLGDHMYVEGVYSDKIVLRNEKTKEIFDIPAKIKLGKDDEEMSIEIDYDKMKKSEVQKEFSEKKMADDKEYPEDDSHSTDEKDDKEVEDDDEDVEEGTKEFSLDANADISAYLEMLENETEEYRELAKKVLADMESDKGLVMQEYVKMAKERDELKKFKETKEAEAKELEVNRTLMEAKEDLTDEEFTCLKEEGMACKSEEMTAFVNKVKAFAYNNAKKNPRKEETSDEHKTYLKMAFDWDSKLSKSTAPKSAEEIYNKYL